MKYIELKAGMPAITNLSKAVTGALALKAVRIIKPLLEAYKEYDTEVEKLFMAAGAENKGGGLSVPKPDPENKSAMEDYNKLIKEWSEMQQTEVAYEIKERIPASSLEETKVTAADLMVLFDLGIVEDDL